MAVDGQFGKTLYSSMVSICFYASCFFSVFSLFPAPHKIKTQYIFLYLFLTTDVRKTSKATISKNYLKLTFLGFNARVVS